MEGPILDFLAKLADIADRIGAFALALAIVLAFLSGRVVRGQNVIDADADLAEAHAGFRLARDEYEAEFQSRITYLEARVKEERADRVAAELAMRSLIDKLDSVASLVHGLKEEVIRGGIRDA